MNFSRCYRNRAQLIYSFDPNIMLYQYHKDEIRMDILKTAVLHTARKRGSLEEINDWKEVLHDIREEPILNQLWKNYTSENSYASKLAFSEVLDTVDEIASGLNF